MVTDYSGRNHYVELQRQERPDFATVPGPGQELVRDYPRPPVIKSCAELVEVKLGDPLFVFAFFTAYCASAISFIFANAVVKRLRRPSMAALISSSLDWEVSHITV